MKSNCLPKIIIIILSANEIKLSLVRKFVPAFENWRSIVGEWINEFERQSLYQRNPYVLEPLMAKNVLAARDSPCINPLT